MSKTTGKNKITNPNEFYETPAWCTKALLNELNLDPKNVLDPCVGTGAIAGVVREMYPAANLLINDIDKTLLDKALTKLKFEDLRSRIEEGLPQTNYSVGSYLDICPGKQVQSDEFDLIILNPPFSLAQEFVEKSFELSPNGTVAVLLRLNWLGSKKRIAFHKKNPSNVYVLPKRPSFTNDGRTDGTEYAWFVFGPKFKGNEWHILDIG